jgi:hypothetical protein
MFHDSISNIENYKNETNSQKVQVCESERKDTQRRFLEISTAKPLVQMITHKPKEEFLQNSFCVVCFCDDVSISKAYKDIKEQKQEQFICKPAHKEVITLTHFCYLQRFFISSFLSQ